MNTTILYLDNIALDMHQDEPIVLKKNVKDIQDVSVILSDYSRSFNVPATDRNNAIFENYYLVDVVGSFNPHLKIPARIEVGGVVYMEGYCEMTAVSMDRNRPSDYALTFYGDIANFKNIFGEAKIADLDFSGLEHELNYTNVTNSWSKTLLSGGVVYPLFNYSRPWLYSTDPAAPALFNIAAQTGGIRLAELKPAVSIGAILTQIQTDFNLTFSSPLVFDQSWFTDLYLLAHKAGGDLVDTDELTNNIVEATANDVTVTNTVTKIPYLETYDAGNNFNSSTNTYTVANQGVHTFAVRWFGDPATSIDGLIYMYVNGVQNGAPVSMTSFPGSINFTRTLSAGDLVTFHSFRVTGSNFLVDQFFFRTLAFPTVNYGGTVNIGVLMPDMRIIDFLNSLCKMYNLVITYDGVQYVFTPLESYYAAGRVVDINNAVDRKSLAYEKVPIFKKVDFRYKEQKDAVNTIYRESYGKNYGQSTFTPVVDFAVDELTVEPDFGIMPTVEMLNQDRTGAVINGTGIRIARFLNKEDKPTYDAPVIFAFQKAVNCSKYYLQNSQTATAPGFTLVGRVPICEQWGSMPASINYSIEASTFANVLKTTLYSSYYNKFLQRTYNKQSRVLKVSMKMTTSEMLKLSMSDRLFFDGHYWVYNWAETNVNTGLIKAELVSYYPDYVERRVLDIDGGGNVTFEGGGDDLLIEEGPTFGITTTPSGPILIDHNDDLNNVTTSPGATWGSLPSGDASGEVLTWNGETYVWQAISAGVDTFIGLTDTPSTYTGTRFPVTNDAANQLIWSIMGQDKVGINGDLERILINAPAGNINQEVLTIFPNGQTTNKGLIVKESTGISGTTNRLSLAINSITGISGDLRLYGSDITSNYVYIIRLNQEPNTFFLATERPYKRNLRPGYTGSSSVSFYGEEETINLSGAAASQGATATTTSMLSAKNWFAAQFNNPNSGSTHIINLGDSIFYKETSFGGTNTSGVVIVVKGDRHIVDEPQNYIDRESVIVNEIDKQAGMSEFGFYAHKSNGGIFKQPLPTYADNDAAIAGGLTTDMWYKTSDGKPRIVV